MFDERRDASEGRAREAALRVGGIDYLNALPLLYGLESRTDPPLELSYHPPSQLASLLREGRLDLALVPVVAYVERPDYHIVPGVAISSYGPVRSIRLYHRRPLSEARTVALDTSSRTSVLITRLLYREVWGGDPRFVPLAPEDLRRRLRNDEDGLPDFDAALLIGDAALSCSPYDGWEEVDLGGEWTRWSGLPSVYAFWVCRTPQGLPAGLVETFQQARDEGVARIDEIIASTELPDGVSASACRHYLSQVVHYDLRSDKREALELLFRKLREHGLLGGRDEPLRFLPSAVAAAL